MQRRTQRLFNHPFNDGNGGKNLQTPPRENSGHGVVVQPKLTIGQTNDKYEQEADRVAAQVVQEINRPAPVSHTQGEVVQSMEKEEEDSLNMKPMVQGREAIGGGEASTDLESAINRPRGSGQPLDEGLQQSMGQAMGADFSGVRVHTDSQADQLNQSLQAKAFTTGPNLFFKKGEYQPGSRGGQELIAHELTHVVQQNSCQLKQKRITQAKHYPSCGCPTCRLQSQSLGKLQAKEDTQTRSRIAPQNHLGTPSLVIPTYSPSISPPEFLSCQLSSVSNELIIQRDVWDYLSTVGISLFSLPYAWIISNIQRIPSLLRHIIEGVIGIFQWLWDGLMTLVGQRNQTIMDWLYNGLLDAGGWLFRLFTRAIDVVGLPEVMNLVMNILNFHSRQLTNPEKAAGQLVYGNNISYWQVKVSTQKNFITALYNLIAGGQMIAITAFHYIEVTPPHDQNLNNIVHELGHVKQYESVGSQYMGEAIHAALRGAGYNYNATDLAIHPLSWFNREQQCRIAEHYWALQTSPTLIAAMNRVPSMQYVNINAALGNAAATPRQNALILYQPLINDFRNGRV